MLYYLLHSLVSLMFVGTRGDHACPYFPFMNGSSGSHEEIVLAYLFCLRTDLHRHTKRSFLTFFSDWFNLRSMTFSSDFFLLARVEIMLAFLF